MTSVAWRFVFKRLGGQLHGFGPFNKLSVGDGLPDLENAKLAGVLQETGSCGYEEVWKEHHVIS